MKQELSEMWVTDFERGFLVEMVFGEQTRESIIVQGV